MIVDTALGETRVGREPASVAILLQCPARLQTKVRYVFDTLLLAAGVRVHYLEALPFTGPCIAYAPSTARARLTAATVFIAHDPVAWAFFEGERLPSRVEHFEGLPLVFPPTGTDDAKHPGIRFDLLANAFYFLSSWAERVDRRTRPSRHLYNSSEFARLNVPQDIVDRYLRLLVQRLFPHGGGPFATTRAAQRWPGGKSFAVVLSHDVDFVPVRPWDNAVQGAKTLLRHLVRQRDVEDTWRAMRGFLSARMSGRDPYGCVPAIIERERDLGVRSSFQVAVGHRHPSDVNYFIENERVRDYLSVVTRSGFDLCLHGSYRSTENIQWYVEEVDLLATCLGRPRGSRQHFLSFDYDGLFVAQEAAGIQYDMSMGYPDRPGPRAGFSYPYFPYNLKEDRPYRVLEISLFLMDVTLSGYMSLRACDARSIIEDFLIGLRDKGGCASVVWHPIVFGGARDPGYDDLYYELVARAMDQGGLAADGRSIHDFWRQQASDYASFQ